MDETVDGQYFKQVSEFLFYGTQDGWQNGNDKAF